MSDFLSKLKKLEEEKKSVIVLAIDDVNFFENNFLRKIKNYVIGIKVGLPVFLSMNLNIQDVLQKFSEDFVFIADLKIADIPYISSLVASIIKKLGFDALIVHSFVGEDTIEAVNKEIPVICVIAMTNRGSIFLDKHYLELLNICNRLNVAGIVAPANKLEILKKIRENTKLKILTPGIGVQGGNYELALKYGADYLIIGRSILQSSDPSLELERILNKIHKTKAINK
jgi:orotidine-5'-phosphate decarboxylase